MQITKEKFKVFHNTIPNNYEAGRERYPVYESIEDVKQVSKDPSWFENFKFQPATEQKPPKDKFPQYNGFSKPKRVHGHPQLISVAPNYPTYEVTEGKTLWPNSGFQITTKPPEFHQGNNRCNERGGGQDHPSFISKFELPDKNTPNELTCKYLISRTGFNSQI